jgi:hypothetical protein
MSSADAAVFGSGPDVPQFSRTEIRSLVHSHPGPIPGPGEPNPDDSGGPDAPAVQGDAVDGGNADTNAAESGPVVFDHDGDRDELDSPPRPADESSPPHPFSSPLAINPLRRQSV